MRAEKYGEGKSETGEKYQHTIDILVLHITSCASRICFKQTPSFPDLEWTRSIHGEDQDDVSLTGVI